MVNINFNILILDDSRHKTTVHPFINQKRCSLVFSIWSTINDVLWYSYLYQMLHSRHTKCHIDIVCFTQGTRYTILLSLIILMLHWRHKKYYVSLIRIVCCTHGPRKTILFNEICKVVCCGKLSTMPHVSNLWNSQRQVHMKHDALMTLNTLASPLP